MNNDQLGFLLHDSARLLRRVFERQAAAHGLSSAQWRLLAHVLRHGAIAQARLADLLEVEAISVSRLIDRMEQAGWVIRLPDPNDRRVKMIAPSDHARAMQTQIKSIAATIYTDALAPLTPDAQAALLAGLATLNQTLLAQLNDTSPKDSQNDD